MTFQGLPAASHTARGFRMNQPSDTRETRKPPQSNMVRMCDGSEISHRVYDHLRSTACQKFRGTHHGCAQAVRQAIPREQWDVISEWMDEHRPQFGNGTAQNDGMMAILIGYAARRRQQNVACLFDEIVETRTAKMIISIT